MEASAMTLTVIGAEVRSTEHGQVVYFIFERSDGETSERFYVPGPLFRAKEPIGQQYVTMTDAHGNTMRYDPATKKMTFI